MQNDLPKRKNPRLKGYDYNSNGYYFITICTKDKREILGKIVGRGILDAPHIELSEHGINICNTIKFVNKNSKNIIIDKYVVMPNHVHMIVMVNTNDVAKPNNGASRMPRPTNAIIPKTLSSIKRYTNKLSGFNIWQNGYHDHIIRNEQIIKKYGNTLTTIP